MFCPFVLIAIFSYYSYPDICILSQWFLLCDVTDLPPLIIYEVEKITFRRYLKFLIHLILSALQKFPRPMCLDFQTGLVKLPQKKILS